MGVAQVETVYIPKFTYSGEVSDVTFGGFETGKYTASQPTATADDDNPDVADSTDPGTVPATSRPMVAPWRYITYYDARKVACNLGVGWHLMTVFEWASLAFLSKKLGTQAHGNNANSDPPSDTDYPSETALLDRAGNARDSGWHPSLTGSGPVTWTHNHRADGVFGLSGNMWEWVMGLLNMPATQNDSNGAQIGSGDTTGHVLVLASTEIGLDRAPFGESTATASGSLTDSNKSWNTDEFVDCYILDDAGDLHKISSNTGDTLNITGSATPASGPYEVLKYVATDITSGMSSGNHILTLRNSDADLKPFAIPDTSDASGSADYGNDGYWFNPTALRAARRGGYWGHGAGAGVFALGLLGTPPGSSYYFGLRVSKAI